MKRFVIAMFLGFGVLTAKSQKLEKPVVDRISGQVTISTKEQTLTKEFTPLAHYLGGSIFKAGEACSLYLHLQDAKQTVYYLSAGDHSMIKLQDGKLLDIVVSFNTQSSVLSYKDLFVTESFIQFALTDDGVAALKSSNIIAVRINTSEGPFDYDVDNGKSEVIKKQLQLIYGK